MTGYQEGTVYCADCTKKRAEEAVWNARRRLEELIADIPVEFRETDEEKLPDKKAWEQVKECEFGKRGLLLVGPTRSGKSRSAFLIVKREMIRHRRVQWLTAFKLIPWPAMWMSDSAAMVESLKQLAAVDLLLLDDVFKAKLTERVEEALFALLDERANHGRPTIITLNDTGLTLQSRLSDDRGAALIERMREFCRTIVFKPKP